MEIYRSEEEQLEALKKWWKENGRSAIFGVVIGISLFGGWSIWQANRNTKAEQASDLFQELLTAVNDEKDDSAFKMSERIIDLHGGTSYSVYAQLFKAKLQMEKGELPAAEETLEAILESGSDKNFQHIARTRLIRLLAVSGDPESGLKMIAATDIAQSGSFESIYEELRGDLYVKLNKEDEARASYQRAQELESQSPYLQLKIDDLEVQKIPALSEEEAVRE